MAKTVSKIAAMVLVLTGLAGIALPHMFGGNWSFAENVIHLFSAALASYFGTSATYKGARIFCAIMGVLYLVLGIAGFAVHLAPDRVLTIIPRAMVLEPVDHVIHVIIGTAFIIGAINTRTLVTT